MTPKEALEGFIRLKDDIDENNHLFVGTINPEWIQMAIEALAKQIPKKPVMINRNEEFDGNWKKVCPRCERMLMERITTSEVSYPKHYNMTGYCWCGQAILWE